MARLLAAGAVALGLMAFAFHPAMTWPLGDRLEATSRRAVERGGCQGINLVVTSEQMADLGRVTIKADGRPLTWTWIVRQRDFDRRLLELRFAEMVPRGAELEVTAPFPLHYRPLYWPPMAERIDILIGRLSRWLPRGGQAFGF